MYKIIISFACGSILKEQLKQADFFFLIGKIVLEIMKKNTLDIFGLVHYVTCF